MPSEVDRQVTRADAVLDRSRARRDALARRGRERRTGELLRRLGRVALADAAILIAALAIGFIVPLGMFGALAVIALLIAATLLFAIFPLTTTPTAETLAQTPLKALPLQTEQWLEQQRLALPAPARTLADAIGVRLETLTPQLATLNEAEPVAAELRKLIGEQLPELVRGYAKVPEPLRGVERNGLTSDQQLAQGLTVIEQQLGELSNQLAQGDLDQLATRERFLQIKYRDEDMDGNS